MLKGKLYFINQALFEFQSILFSRWLNNVQTKLVQVFLLLADAAVFVLARKELSIENNATKSAVIGGEGEIAQNTVYKV